MHSRLPVNSRAAQACAIDLLGGRVRHTRTICSFLGSLATHELFRYLLRSIITKLMTNLHAVEQLEHAQ